MHGIKKKKINLELLKENSSPNMNIKFLKNEHFYYYDLIENMIFFKIIWEINLYRYLFCLKNGTLGLHWILTDFSPITDDAIK